MPGARQLSDISSDGANWVDCRVAEAHLSGGQEQCPTNFASCWHGIAGRNRPVTSGPRWKQISLSPSVIRKAPGYGARMRTPAGCCGSTSRREPARRADILELAMPKLPKVFQNSCSTSFMSGETETDAEIKLGEMKFIDCNQCKFREL